MFSIVSVLNCFNRQIAVSISNQIYFGFSWSLL